jgi:hypothetical protein
MAVGAANAPAAYVLAIADAAELLGIQLSRKTVGGKMSSP